MKNKLLLLLVGVMVLFQQKAFAQLPEISTAEKPTWYFIQVVGSESSREDRVFVVKDGYLYGEALSANKDAQLFRFEKNENQYFIISKSTNQKLDVGMKDNEESLKLSDEGIGFTLDPLAEKYYNITASSTPAGGDASKKWAHQSNGNSSYKIILVSTTWSSGANSQFSFIPSEDINLEYSTAGNETWYSIESAGTNSGCITDISATQADIKMSIEDFEQDNNNQLWKLVSDGSKVNFVNKATGNMILTQSDVSENNLMYNYTQLTNTNSNGWTLSHIRVGQYAISGVEEDNITRYLNASAEEAAPDVLDSSKLISSNFAWRFKRAEEQTSIPSIQEIDDIQVYSENKRIIVKGTNDYIVRTIQGTVVNKNTELPVGIYLVTVNGKTTKLLVK